MTIIHTMSDIKKYRKWSAFFRLLGIFVCEKLEEDDEETDLTIRTDQYEEAGIAKVVFKDMTDGQSLEILTLAEDIFVNNDLMRGSYAIDYFSASGEQKIYADMEKSHERFGKAISALDDLMQEKKDIISQDVLKYLLSAKANCMRRMNQLYTILWDAISEGLYKEGSKDDLFQKKYYKHEEMEEVIRKVLSIDSQFYSAYVSRAFFEILDDDTKVDAINSIITAMNMIGNKPYASSLRYFLGRCYEYVLIRPEKSLANYKKAYELYNNNYRAIFKLAVFAQSAHKENEAIEWLDKILIILDKKKELPVLQPIECAYLYKAYKNKGQIYLNQKRYEECLDMMEKAVAIYKNDKNEAIGGLYRFMFDENSVYYKEAARKKLEIWKVYANMAEAAAMSDRYDEYKVYSAKVEDTKGVYN